MSSWSRDDLRSLVRRAGGEERTDKECDEVIDFVRSSSETAPRWRASEPPGEGMYRSRPVSTKVECGNVSTGYFRGLWLWVFPSGERTPCSDQNREWRVKR